MPASANLPTGEASVVLIACSASSVGMCRAILSNAARVSGGLGVIVGVVVGGVLPTGGFRTVLGTPTAAAVGQCIPVTRIDRNRSNLVIGAMLLVAVALNEGFRRMALGHPGPNGRT